jgi:hypothetical protein
MNRKDINFNKYQHREVTYFLAYKLDLFMRQVFEKVIDIASVKN